MFLKFIWNVMTSWRTLLAIIFLGGIVYLNPIITSQINHDGIAVNQKLWITAAIIIIFIIYKSDQHRKFLLEDQDTSLPQSYREFKKLYWKAKLGNTIAQRKFADCYFYGHGVKQDYMKAMDWYEKAAAKGSILAKFKVIEANIKGYACIPNYEYAEQELAKLAKEGNQDASCRLWQMFEFDCVKEFFPANWDIFARVYKSDEWRTFIVSKKHTKGLIAIAIFERISETKFELGDEPNRASYDRLKNYADKGHIEAIEAIINDKYVLPEDLEKYTAIYEPYKKAKEELEEKNRKASEAIAAKLPKRFNKRFID